LDILADTLHSPHGFLLNYLNYMIFITK